MFLLLTLFLVVSCSGASDIGVVPANENDASGMDVDGTGACLGLWQVAIDADSEQVDIVDLRTSNQVINVLCFLEPPALTNLNIDFDTLQIKPAQKYIGVDVILRNPLTSTTFKGFDVRGVVFGPEVSNADGLTVVLSPEFFTGVPFGYIDGLLGAPDSYAHYNSTLNGYKYYCDDLEVNDDISVVDPIRRGMFTPGQKNVRRFHIDLGDEGLIFNYAIDACWEFPQGDFPWVAPDDFSPNANRPEPYRLSISEIDKTLFYDPELQMAEGEVTLLIDVYDWFDADLNTIKVECGDIFTPLIADTPVGGGVGYSTYQVDILDAQPTATKSSKGRN